MSLKCESTAIPEVLLITPRVFGDPRGFFLETFHQAKYRAAGINRAFVQDNYSHSCRDTLRGLHFQLRHPQAKLVSVIWGRIFDVAVDIRSGSPTFGRWVGQELSDDNRCQLYIPEGFAHGFVVLSATALVAYKCTDFYRASCQAGLAWNDPQLAIRWPVANPILSPQDEAQPRLADIPLDSLPQYEAPAEARVMPRLAA